MSCCVFIVQIGLFSLCVCCSSLLSKKRSGHLTAAQHFPPVITGSKKCCNESTSDTNVWVFLCVVFFLDILFRIGHLQWIADLFHNREADGSLQCRHVRALQLIQYGGNHSSKSLSYSDNGGAPFCNFPRGPSLHKSKSSFVLLWFYGRETLVRTFPVLGSTTPTAISVLEQYNGFTLYGMQEMTKNASRAELSVVNHLHRWCFWLLFVCDVLAPCCRYWCRLVNNEQQWQTKSNYNLAPLWQ